MRHLRIALALAAVTCMCPATELLAQAGPAVDTVVTALAKNGETPAPIPVSALEIKLDGKKVQPLDWQQYGNGPVQLVILIDSSLRSSFGRSIDDVAQFLQGLPPNVSTAVAYMANGAAIFESPLTADHRQAVNALHLPGGSPGSNASPYFCLRDLAEHWPAAPSNARREVVMISDGVDPYNLRYDPEDPYLTAAIDASNRAHMVVFSIFWHNQGFLSRTLYETNAGQNYLFQVADATGGTVYYEGTMNPVSLTPFFKDLSERLNNQYELVIPVKPEKKVYYADLRLKSSGVKTKAPNRVVVPPIGSPNQP